jgi:uncharacterized protein
MTKTVGDTDQALAALAAQRFVSLTTYRNNGEQVATPVWIGRDGDAVFVMTPASSFKVKRLRRDPRVRLVPSSRGGRVRTGEEPVDSVAQIVEDAAEVARLRAVLQHKYGLEFRLATAVERLTAKQERRRVILRIKFAADPN